jgi:hypothetical protein
MSPVTQPVAVEGSLAAARNAAWYVVVPEASAHSIRARYALHDVPVWAAQEELRVGGQAVPAGAWLIEAGRVGADRMQRLAREHGLTVLGATAAAVASVRRHELDLPRIAVLHSWRNTQDEGWARYTLDQMGVPFAYVGEDRLKGRDLRAEFDVVLFPSQGANSSAKAIFQGVDPRFGPLAYTRTAEFPSHGFPDSSEDITGGMGFEGLAALRDFVQRGGTLVTLGSASTLPVEYGLVREVNLATPRSLFVPGSIVGGRNQQAGHPIMYGYGESFPLYHRFGPYLNVPRTLQGNVLARYAPASELFLSGLVQNPGELAGNPAIVTTPVGSGHIVLFGFNPLHRYQSHGNFAFVWNAIMNWNDLSVGLPPARPAPIADDVH